MQNNIIEFDGNYFCVFGVIIRGILRKKSHIATAKEFAMKRIHCSWYRNYAETMVIHATYQVIQ